MGVWQMIESGQPYVGQWDAVTDTFWDGMCWSPSKSYLAKPPVSVLNFTTPKMMWPALRALYMEQEVKKEAPKAQDPWEALKSMF